MELQDDTKGHISTEHTVWCGCCSEWNQQAYATKKQMKKWAKRVGWIFTRRYGWLCPKHAEEYRIQSR